MDAKTADVINKVIAVLGYISVGILALVGIIIVAASDFASQMIAEAYPMVGGFIGTIITLVGLLLIALAVLEFFISKGLWEHKNWARITSLVFACIGVAIAIPTIALISLAINGFMIYFYGFDKGVKELFK